MLSSPDIAGGTTGLPAPGTPFITTGTFQSRRVSSWLVGDGAQLLNAIVGSNPGFNQPQRVTPLDSVANNPLADRKGGGSFGFRVSRELTPRIAAEFNFDYATVSVEARNGVQSGLDATTSSFRTVFQNEVFLPSLLFAGKTVTTSNSLAVEEGSEMAVTGAVKFNILTRGMFRPYVTGGAGVTRQRGDFPVATAEGRYTFRILSVFPFDERDSVTLTQTYDESVFVGVVGGGVNVHLRANSGIRVDVRAHVGTSNEQVLLDAAPTVTLGTPGFSIFSVTNPGISFNSLPQPSVSPPSSLSGAAVNDFVTFDSSRTRTQVTWSVGYFFRF
jgi:hypothetical protein